MGIRLRTYARCKPVRAALAMLCALALVAYAAEETASWVHLRWYASRLSALEATAPVPDRSVALRFDFRGQQLEFDVPLSTAAVRHAEEFDFSPTFSRRGPWRPRYVGEAVRIEARSGFIGGFADTLRAERRRLGLNSDAYLELIVRTVQNIPYGTPGARLKTPIEVVATGSGICTEKTVLMAALLLHEGYETAVWSLDSHQHVGVGVGTVGGGYRGSGFAYVEATEPAYIGQISSRFAASGPVYSPPQLIRLGGHARYAADAQVGYILGLRDSAGTCGAVAF